MAFLARYHPIYCEKVNSDTDSELKNFIKNSVWCVHSHCADVCFAVLCKLRHTSRYKKCFCAFYQIPVKKILRHCVPQNNKCWKHGCFAYMLLLCHPERQRRILCTFDSEKILRHCVPQNDKRRQISYWCMRHLFCLCQSIRLPKYCEHSRRKGLGQMSEPFSACRKTLFGTLADC